MKKKGVAKAVQAVFASLLSETRGKRFDPTKRQTEYRGWDSFVHMQLAAKIEEACNVELSMKEIIQADSAALFVEIVTKKL